MTSLLVASLEVQWRKNEASKEKEYELLFFHHESGMYFDVFRPYPEIANLAITIIRKGLQVGLGTVWISSERKHGAFASSFVGFEDYFGFPSDYFESSGEKRKDRLRPEYLTPYFFAPGDTIEVHDGISTWRFFSGDQYRRRFINAVFNDFMSNSFFGIEGVELLWEGFLDKYQPSHTVIAAMLSRSRRDGFLSWCLCGSQITNGDIIQGNKLWDQWILSITEWRQTVTSQKDSSGRFLFREGGKQAC